MAQSRYLPYGQERWTSGTLPTDFTFTGQRAERGFGLVDSNARYYDPYLNRFISPDSIVPEPGDPQNLNRFSYVLNNSLKHTDPSGHIICGTPDRPCPPPTRIDISSLHPLARQGLQVACYAIGCHVDVESGTLTGPTFEESIEMSLSPNPVGMVEVPAATAGKRLVKEGVEQLCEQAPQKIGVVWDASVKRWRDLTTGRFVKGTPEIIAARSVRGAPLTKGGVVSLGHFEPTEEAPLGYIEWAKANNEKYGGVITYFDMHAEVYGTIKGKKIGNKGISWLANERFLDMADEAGVIFHLTQPDPKHWDTGFGREIRYLENMGYKNIEEGGEWWMTR